MPPIHRRGRRAYLRELWEGYAYLGARHCEVLGVEPVRSSSPDGIFNKAIVGSAQWPIALIKIDIPEINFDRSVLLKNDPRRRHFVHRAPNTCSSLRSRRDTQPLVTRATETPQRPCDIPPRKAEQPLPYISRVNAASGNRSAQREITVGQKDAPLQAATSYSIPAQPRTCSKPTKGQGKLRIISDVILRSPLRIRGPGK